MAAVLTWHLAEGAPLKRSHMLRWKMSCQHEPFEHVAAWVTSGYPIHVLSKTLAQPTLDPSKD